MTLPTAITFHGLESSDWIHRLISARAQSLGRYCRRISACRVVVDARHRHHRPVKGFSVRIDLTVPGEEIVVTQHAEAADLRAVIRDAFAVTRRRLRDYTARRRQV
jgi:ribosome-associated translation inhibitor RaiA